MKKKEVLSIAQNEVVTTESILTMQERLQAQLEELNHKKALADKRDLFISKKNALNEFLEEFNQEDTEGNFETNKAKISFIIERPGYRESEKFNVSIPEMVESYVMNLLTDIEAAIEGIEKELISY